MHGWYFANCGVEWLPKANYHQVSTDTYGMDFDPNIKPGSTFIDSGHTPPDEPFNVHHSLNMMAWVFDDGFELSHPKAPMPSRSGRVDR